MARISMNKTNHCIKRKLFQVTIGTLFIFSWECIYCISDLQRSITDAQDAQMHKIKLINVRYCMVLGYSVDKTYEQKNKSNSKFLLIYQHH